MELIDHVHGVSIKIESVSPNHQEQTSEVSVTEQQLASVMSERYLKKDELNTEEPVRHNGGPSRVKYEIEIDSAVIQARLASKVETVGISELPGTFSRDEQHLNIKECNIDATTSLNNCVEKPFSCYLCNYKTNIKYSLTKHIRIHTLEKPYSCHICGFKTKLKSYLSRHFRTHTEELPYSCHMCNYKTIQKSKLIIHTRTHTGEKPYSCYLCNYKTNEKYTLMRHVGTHSEEKPFSCYLCNFKTKQKSYLTKHIRIHTGKKP